VSNATGSAFVEFGATKVIVAVYGPLPSSATFSDTAELVCEFKYATFASKSREIPYIPDAEEKELGQLMSQSLGPAVRLDLYPKSSINISTLVIQADGGAFAAAIVAGSLALADAGIEMIDLVAASSSAKVDGQVLIDPTEAEEEAANARVTIAYMPSLNEVAQIIQTGKMEEDAALEAVELTIDGCAKTHALMKAALVHSLEKTEHKKHKKEEKERANNKLEENDPSATAGKAKTKKAKKRQEGKS